MLRGTYVLSGMLCLWTAGSMVALEAWQQAKFRARVEVVELDVLVLDKNNKPVRGLTASNFTIVDGRQRRPIVAFSAVEVPRDLRQGWLRSTAPDVTSNTPPNGRIVVIVMDDGSMLQTGGPQNGRWAVLKAKQIAEAAIAELGANDLGAVVYTQDRRTSQNLTSDRGRLLAAVETGALGVIATSESDPNGNERGACVCGVCSISTLQTVASTLQKLPHLRKLIIYISAGVHINNRLVRPGGVLSPPTHAEDCNLQRREAMTGVFHEAQRSNVTIYPIDVNGLLSIPREHLNYLRSVAENTGGRAILNTNSQEAHIAPIFAENSAYYLLGFETDPDTSGQFRSVRVRVDRSDARVRARQQYYVPTTDESKSPRVSSAEESWLSDVLPTADIPLRLGLIPVRGPGNGGTIAFTLGVQEPAVAATNQSTVSATIAALALNQFGKTFGAQRYTIEAMPRIASKPSYEVTSLLNVPPGRYEVRVGVSAASVGSGSVYGYVDVPDFTTERLSLSGVIVKATPSARIVEVPDVPNYVLPAIPTVRRVFSASDQATALVRVYQGGSDAPVDVLVKSVIVDSDGRTVFSEERRLESEGFAGIRAMDHGLDVPLSRLAEGDYMLMFEVSSGALSRTRALRFGVK